MAIGKSDSELNYSLANVTIGFECDGSIAVRRVWTDREHGQSKMELGYIPAKSSEADDLMRILTTRVASVEKKVA